MLVYIFANGPFRSEIDLTTLTGQTPALIVAADGGAENCRQLNITPHIVTGDLDSISSKLAEEYIKMGVEVIRHPTKKDATDLELALDLATSRGADKVILFYALGGRWDMSLSNVMLTASEKYKQMRISLIDLHCQMYIIHKDYTLDLRGYPGQTISLIPLTADVRGVTAEGFEYPLIDSTLSFGSSRGLSNILLQKKGRITLKCGVLLCIQTLPAY